MLPLVHLQDIKFESLDDGPGILPYKLGPMKIATHYHTFLQYIKLDDIEDKTHSLQNHLQNYKNQLPNGMYSAYEIQISYLLNKLDEILNQIKSLQPTRSKRGIIDGLGTVIKSITGNLDYTDALRYNEAIKLLESNQDKITNEINNQLSISKEWITKYNSVLTQLVENQSKINSTLMLILSNKMNNGLTLIKYAKFGQLLVILSENINDLMNELLRIENSLAFIHASSMHHSMISIDVLSSMIDKLKSIYGKDSILDLEIREYYNIIQPASYYANKQIVFIFRFPIISRDNFLLYRLAVVPNKKSQALIPSSPFIATNENSFLYIEAECPKHSSWYLCQTELNHQIRTNSDCIHQLIINQILEESCHLTTVNLLRGSMEKLDDMHYIISFPENQKIQISCNKQEFTSLKGSYLVTIPLGCQIISEEFTLINDNNEVRGQPLKLIKISDEIAHLDTTINISSINIHGLHRLNDKIMIQSPLQIEHEKDTTVYHTTIPIYAILFSAGALIILLQYKKYKKTTVKNKEILENGDNPESNEKASSPATFSLNILK